ncbi:MAG: excinuclease ABC subunit UvrA [Clostridia bacterium]
MQNQIVITGARENNLKNVNVTIPRDKLVVFTGLSGSGKSSLAFDTIFAEGQRRYMESLSSYARQFLGQMQKPDVDSIEGLSPAIAIDQKTTSNNPRSTVGTVTEIYDYFRLLFSSLGKPYCINCGTEIKSQTVDAIIERTLKIGEGTKILVEAPVVRARKGEFKDLFEGFKKQGFVRVSVDGEVRSLDEPIDITKTQKHNICVVVDRIILKEESRSRLSGSIETAINLANGLVQITVVDGEKYLFSTKNSCSNCGYSFEEITPRLFSFNTPIGACPECTGLGNRLEVREELVVPNNELSIAEGAIVAFGWNDGAVANMYYDALSKKYGFSLKTPFKDLPQEIRDMLFYGNNDELLEMKHHSATFEGKSTKSFEGIINNIYRRHRESTSEFAKMELEKLMIARPCEACHGKRLNKQALSVKIEGKNIGEVTDMSITNILAWLNSLSLSQRESKIAKDVLKEIKERLKFLVDVGLSYLTLSRSAGTLSGGEAQRIRLATQIGSGLVGVIYILDEPSIGLHPRDTNKLIKTLIKLRDNGNSIIVVEHDEDMMRAADYIVDVGPKAGAHGGKIVACGSLSDIENCEASITGQYLSGKRKIHVPSKRRVCDGKYLEIIGARQNNLKNINVKIPLGVFTAITGVSGSGKSSLVSEIIEPRLANVLNRAVREEGACDEIRGTEYLDKVVVISQSPIGRTPRSNPATYTGVFTPIRELFASLPEAKARGYTASRFSFNVSGGRCEACSGDGLNKIEMHFLPDVYVTCEECHGNRYNTDTLEIKFKGKNISDVLDMTVEEALKFFENVSQIKNKLQSMSDVGLSYIKLGQSAITLSGGEAQRVKLATELSKRPTGKTIYILDEPTTGLHSYDTEKLINILQRLVNNKNTVLVVEHNLELLKVVDYIIDLGPEGGEGGGKIIATGTPEEIVKCSKSDTGKYLKKILLE